MKILSLGVDMGLGSVISGATRIGSGAVKALTGAASSLGSSNWLPLAGSLAGAGASLAGGIYAANKSQQVANNVNLLNYKQAKEFAQNQLQWRVDDAKKAGLHPLVGVGASLYQGVPSAIGGDVSGIGNGLSEMGQNISRAIDSYQTHKDRLEEQRKAEALQALQYKLQLDKFALDQRETESRINLNNARAAREAVTKTSLNNAVRGASFKHGAQPRVPPRPVPKSKGKFVLPGFVKDYFPSTHTYYVTPRGNIMRMPSEQFEQSAQNSWGIPDAYLFVDSLLGDIMD